MSWKNWEKDEIEKQVEAYNKHIISEKKGRKVERIVGLIATIIILITSYFVFWDKLPAPIKYKFFDGGLKYMGDSIPLLISIKFQEDSDLSYSAFFWGNDLNKEYLIDPRKKVYSVKALLDGNSMDSTLIFYKKVITRDEYDFEYLFIDKVLKRDTENGNYQFNNYENDFKYYGSFEILDNEFKVLSPGRRIEINGLPYVSSTRMHRLFVEVAKNKNIELNVKILDLGSGNSNVKFKAEDGGENWSRKLMIPPINSTLPDKVKG